MSAATATAQATRDAGPGPGVAKARPERYPLRHELINRIKSDPTIPRRVHDRAVLLSSVLPLYEGEARVLTHKQLAAALKRCPRTTKAMVWDLADPEYGFLEITFQFEKTYRAETYGESSPQYEQRGNLYRLVWPAWLGPRRDASLAAGNDAQADAEADSDKAPPAPAARPVQAPPKRRAPRYRPGSSPPPADPSPRPSSGSAASSAGVPLAPPSPAQRLAATNAAIDAAIDAGLDPFQREALIELALAALVCPALASFVSASFVLQLFEDAAEGGIDLPVELPRLLKVIRDLARKGLAQAWTSAQIAERFPRFLASDLGATDEEAIRSRLKTWPELAQRDYCGRLVRLGRDRKLGLPSVLELLREALDSSGELRGNALRKHVSDAVRGPQAPPEVGAVRRPVQHTHAYRAPESFEPPLDPSGPAPDPAKPETWEDFGKTRKAWSLTSEPWKTPPVVDDPAEVEAARAELAELVALTAKGRGPPE